MLKPKLRKLANRIYCLEFRDAYDLSMTFLRYQEYYESPKFRGKFFTISEFMEWYSKKYGDGTFSYPVDYVGFNLPSRAIVPVLHTLKEKKYDQWTAYDQLMWDTVYAIKKDMGKDCNPFYLIGVQNPSEDRETLAHEVAHALYTVNPEYRRRMDVLLRRIPKSVWKTMRNRLKGRGYAPNVYKDEAQAYWATGLHRTMDTKGLKRQRSVFKEVHKQFTKDII